MIFKKKKYGGSARVEENSNIVYSAGSNSWQAIRPGSLLQVNDDVNFYQISRAETENFELPFTKSNDKILIKNPLPQLSENDLVFISVKEYQFFSLTSIVDGGKKYKQNDELQMEGGSPFHEISTNTTLKATFRVVDVDDNGSIVKIKPILKGKYLSGKSLAHHDLVGGSGFGAKISAEFEMVGQNAEMEKEISKIERTGSLCFITFANHLAENIIEGYLKFSKSKIILCTNYLGKTMNLATYSILKDFTPNYNMPLMAVDSTTPEVIFNNSLITIDAKLAELEKSIKTIEEAAKRRGI